LSRKLGFRRRPWCARTPLSGPVALFPAAAHPGTSPPPQFFPPKPTDVLPHVPDWRNKSKNVCVDFLTTPRPPFQTPDPPCWQSPLTRQTKTPGRRFCLRDRAKNKVASQPPGPPAAQNGVPRPPDAGTMEDPASQHLGVNTPNPNEKRPALCPPPLTPVLFFVVPRPHFLSQKPTMRKSAAGPHPVVDARKVCGRPSPGAPVFLNRKAPPVHNEAGPAKRRGLSPESPGGGRPIP